MIQATKIFRLFVALFATTLTTAPLASADLPPGWQAFTDGAFQGAIQQGRQSDTPDGLALACRAGLVLGGYQQTGLEAVHSLHAALKDCDKALQQEPTHEIANVSLAIALSFEGKRVRETQYPKAARGLLEGFLHAHPNSTLAAGALGAWHSEVSAAGFLARMALGASRKKAAHNFAQAQALGMPDFALQFEYIKFLAHGDREDRSTAENAIEALLATQPATAFDQLIRARAQQLQKALATNSKKARKAAFMEIAPFSEAASDDNIAAFDLDLLKSLEESK